MELKFETGLNRTQPDPFMYEIEGGWAMYVTAFDGVEAYASDSPFGPFEEAHCMYDHFTIDSHVVQTEAGLFLWYAKNNPEDVEHPGTRVYVERLLDPYTPDGHPKEVIVPTMIEEKSGHHSVIRYEGQYYAVYHGRNVSENVGRMELDNEKRTARICKLHIKDGVIRAERME